MKKGLVLEGGAMRGMFTAGVTDIMMENSIMFDGMVGVSAGAAFGCNYKSGQIGRAIRYNMRFCRNKRYCSLFSLLFTGDLFGAEYCYHTVPEKYDIFDKEAFFSNPMEFYAVATDVLTGKAVYKKLDQPSDDIFEWIRASASMPLASRVVEVDGYKLLDGGMADSVPIRFFESIGYDRNVLILTQPKGYVKKKSSMTALINFALRKYPKLAEAMENRYIMYNDTLKYIEEREAAGEIYVIRPEEALPIDRIEHNPQKLKEVYELGRKAGEKHLQNIIEFLK